MNAVGRRVAVTLVVLVAALSSACVSRLKAPRPSVFSLPVGSKVAMDELLTVNGATGVSVMSVGSGQCVLIICPSGNRILNDCGTISANDSTAGALTSAAKILRDTALRHYLIISHGHTDHYNEVPDVVGKALRLDGFLYGGDAADYLDPDYTKWLAAGQGANLIPPGVSPVADQPGTPNPNIECGIAQGDGLYVLAANAGLGKNDRSVVTQLRVGKFVVDMMGDAEAATEDDIIRRYSGGDASFLHATVLIAAHHGSENNTNTEAWAQATQPKSVIYSAGSRFGHPRCGSVDNYDGQNSIVRVQNHVMTCYRNSSDKRTYDTELADYSTFVNESTVIVVSDGSNWDITVCPYSAKAQCTVSYRGVLQ